MGRSSTSFKAGQSGNSQGKPPGKTYRARFRELADPALPGMVDSLVKAAQAGDMQAIKIVLDRTIPALKPTSDTLSMRAIGTLEERGQAILNAMTTGRIGPDTAKTALDVLAAQAKLIEQGELVARIEQLEALICHATTKP